MSLTRLRSARESFASETLFYEIKVSDLDLPLPLEKCQEPAWLGSPRGRAKEGEPSGLLLPLPLGEVAERSEDGEGSQEVVKRLILLDFEILKRYRYSDIIQIYNKAKRK